jgi:hypothetical protein
VYNDSHNDAGLKRSMSESGKTIAENVRYYYY